MLSLLHFQCANLAREYTGYVHVYEVCACHISHSLTHTHLEGTGATSTLSGSGKIRKISSVEGLTKDEQYRMAHILVRDGSKTTCSNIAEWLEGLIYLDSIPDVATCSFDF